MRARPSPSRTTSGTVGSRASWWVKDDEVVFERYGLGNDENSRWISFSIAKSVVSMLYGAAIADGYIDSVDEPVTKYLPLLAGGGYDGVSIRNVLQMASGVLWNEGLRRPGVRCRDAAVPPGRAGAVHGDAGAGACRG